MCWTVSSGTAAPITEPTITIGTTGYTDCLDCLNTNPCPEFWLIRSCCQNLDIEVIQIPAGTVTVNEIWVDTNGICWEIFGQVTSLPTNYTITLVTLYVDCEDCLATNPCPTEIYITVRKCCEPLVVEVFLYSGSPTTGLVFSDLSDVCWEVISWSLTGTPTISPLVINSQYSNCIECIEVNPC